MVELARHLGGLGHRRVGVLCMRLSTDRNDGFASVDRQDNARYEVQRRRLAGLRDGFTEFGVDWSTVPVVERFDHTQAAGGEPPSSSSWSAPGRHRGRCAPRTSSRSARCAAVRASAA